MRRSKKHAGPWPVCLPAAVAIIAALAAGAPEDARCAASRGFHIDGNSGVSRQTLEDTIEAVACGGQDAAPDSACADAVCRALAEAYWARGYLGAEIRCERTAGDDGPVRVTISEGPASLVAAVRIEGAPPEDLGDLEAAFAPRVGRPFSQADLEADIDRVLASYDTRGYPLASLAPEVRVAGEGGLELTLQLDRGPAARLGAIVLRGLGKTREDVAVRETGLRPGEPYDGARVTAGRIKLERLGVFESVSEPALSFVAEDTTVAVIFDVAEARTTVLEGLAAYAPSARGSRLVGSFNLEMTNLGGSLRRARAAWARPASDRLAWSLYYREPRLAGRPFALEASLASDVVDTSYARRKFWLGLAFVGEGGWEIGTGGFIGSTKDRAAVGGEGDFSEKGVSFRLRREGRSRPLNPVSGSLVEVSQEVESIAYSGGAADRTISGLRVAVQYILGVSATVNLALGGRFEGVFASSGEVPPSHRVKLGGMTSLRGYPEEWFIARQAAVATLEARKMFGPHSRLYGFVDAAALEDATRRLSDLDRLPFGYGVGLMAGAGGGIIRLEIALGRDDTWSDAKLHLGLVERF